MWIYSTFPPIHCIVSFYVVISRKFYSLLPHFTRSWSLLNNCNLFTNAQTQAISSTERCLVLVLYSSLFSPFSRPPSLHGQRSLLLRLPSSLELELLRLLSIPMSDAGTNLLIRSSKLVWTNLFNCLPRQGQELSTSKVQKLLGLMITPMIVEWSNSTKSRANSISYKLSWNVSLRNPTKTKSVFEEQESDYEYNCGDWTDLYIGYLRTD
ncbi:hypothetical protein F5880DRAFT_959871 [Lentinula raphanica]|nr:hypothetical protein F5880DRAFT_959871 [Lentinula raphanica]